MHLAAPVPSTPDRYVPRSRPARGVLAVLAALVPLLVLLAGPAAAAPGGSAGAAPALVATSGDTSESATAAAKPPATAGAHCALAAGAGQQLHCFGTFRAAMAFATGGRVTDAPASSAAAALDPRFTAKVEAANAAATADSAVAPTAVTPAASGVVLGIEYADANFLGATLTLTGGGGCDNSSDVDFRFGSMPTGWNDRITSFNSYSNCAQQLFRSINFTGGALTIIIRSLANVGSAANDQASSITFN